MDVMHIDKNICENIIGTLLIIAWKTMYMITVRIHLEEIGIRPHLYMKKTEGESCKMLEALYTMGKYK